MKTTIYENITKRILEQLEQGVIPWRKPWSFYIDLETGKEIKGATNLSTNKGYNGVNQVLLSIADSDSPYWLTFKQCKKLGGTIKKGSKGKKIIVVVNWPIEDKDTGKKKTGFTIKEYTVFNLEQCDLDEEKKKHIKLTEYTHEEKSKKFTEFISKFSQTICKITQKPSSKACYKPTEDSIIIPQHSQFQEINEFYATACHEMIHATGNVKRLKRFSTETGAYAFEELVAELGSCFVMKRLGLDPPIANNASYIKGWSNRLKRDPKLFVKASSQAQKACDYIFDELGLE